MFELYKFLMYPKLRKRYLDHTFTVPQNVCHKQMAS